MKFNNTFRHVPKAFSTHMALLLKVLDVSDGDVLELGGGIFSTPMLHWYCKNKGRRLITYENFESYYNFERQFQSRTHSIRFIKNWDEIDTKTRRGLVFIDHGGKKTDKDPGGSRRGIDAIRFKNTADYIVLHDTQPTASHIYGYDEMWPHFKYRFDWKECVPHTSVISNFKDLSWLN